VAAADFPVAMSRSTNCGHRRTRRSVLAVGVVTAASVLAACGSGSVTSSSGGAVSMGGTAAPAAPAAGSGESASGGSASGGPASGIPKACTLVLAAQVSAALDVPINRTSEKPEGSGTECSWSFTSTSLVKGLGTNATLDVKRSAAGMTRSSFYQSIENVQQLQFAPVNVDGIPAVQGFGSSQPEVVIDVGPVTITIAALSTISATDDGPAALAIAGDAVSNMCHMVRCSH